MTQPDMEIAASRHKLIDRNLRRASRDRNYRRSIFGLPPLPDPKKPEA